MVFPSVDLHVIQLVWCLRADVLVSSQNSLLIKPHWMNSLLVSGGLGLLWFATIPNFALPKFGRVTNQVLFSFKKNKSSTALPKRWGFVHIVVSHSHILASNQFYSSQLSSTKNLVVPNLPKHWALALLKILAGPQTKPAISFLQSAFIDLARTVFCN